MKPVARLKAFFAAKSSLSSIIYNGASRIGVLTINLATGIILARTLGPAGRGAASAISIWAPLICGLLTLGVPVSLRYTIRQKTDDPADIFSTALALSLLSSIASIVAGWLVIPRSMAQYPIEVVHFAQAMMFFAPLISANAVLQGFLEARGEFARSGSMLYLPTIGTLLSLVLLLFLHRMNPYTVSLSYEIPFSLITLSIVWRARSFVRFRVNFVKRARTLLNFGLRAYVLDILNSLSVQVGQLLVVGFLSEGSFGLYSVALNLSRTVGIIGLSLNTVLFPRASELSKDEAVRLVSRSAKGVLAASALSGGALILLMPFLIRLAYGNQYLPVVGAARLLTCEIILGVTVGTMAQAFMATGRPGTVAIFQIVGLCTSVPMMILLIPRFGLIGAAMALLGSTSVRLVTVLISYPVLLKHPMPSFIPTLQDFRDIRTFIKRRSTPPAV